MAASSTTRHAGRHAGESECLVGWEEDLERCRLCAAAGHRGVVAVGVVLLVGALGAALAAAVRRDRGALLLAAPTVAVQEWEGRCSAGSEDVAYLFRKPLENRLEGVSNAEHCCRYCHLTTKCKAWSWVRHTKQCYMEDTLPVKNVTKVGFWSGTPLPRGDTTTLAGSSSPTAPPSLLPASSGLLGRAAAVVARRAGAGSPISGGAPSKACFAGFLAAWRQFYRDNHGLVPDVVDAALPAAFRGFSAKVVSDIALSGGVTSEGMGKGIMVEAFKAAAGDKAGLSNGLALLRGWIGMVYGPPGHPHPLGGGGLQGGADDVASPPYGVSAIAGSGLGGSPVGVIAREFATAHCSPTCPGSRTSGDEDAVLGMVYLALTLGKPVDFVDMTVRAIIAFASADLGFPDLYRTLPDGTKVFVPKGGSESGGLLPEHGKYASSKEAWCYSPSHFAPAHYRTFRDFVKDHWRPWYDEYLPPCLDDKRTSLADLLEAFDGAVIAGYNILYYASCESGAVSGWVGVKAECRNAEALACAGVPWAQTPYLGSSATCHGSGDAGAGAGTSWRIAMDYILYPEESSDVPQYDRMGVRDTSRSFHAASYLQRLSERYRHRAACGGSAEGCRGAESAAKLSAAFDDSGLTCEHVPKGAQSWWAPVVAWPSFVGFVAPSDGLRANQSVAWLDTFALLCAFDAGGLQGKVCSPSYFDLDQELAASMVMAGGVVPLKTAVTLV